MVPAGNRRVLQDNDVLAGQENTSPDSDKLARKGSSRQAFHSGRKRYKCFPPLDRHFIQGGKGINAFLKTSLRLLG